MNIFDACTAALQAHWKAHANKYPRKFVLGASQHDELTRLRQMGHTAVGARSPLDPDSFMDVPIERRQGAAGLMVEADEAEVPLGL